jgi:hypothetical protein
MLQCTLPSVSGKCGIIPPEASLEADCSTILKILYMAFLNNLFYTVHVFYYFHLIEYHLPPPNRFAYGLFDSPSRGYVLYLVLLFGQCLEMSELLVV